VRYALLSMKEAAPEEYDYEQDRQFENLQESARFGRTGTEMGTGTD